MKISILNNFLILFLASTAIVFLGNCASDDDRPDLSDLGDPGADGSLIDSKDLGNQAGDPSTQGEDSSSLTSGSCIENKDCELGKICGVKFSELSEGQCIPGCIETTDCPSLNVCANGSCIAEGDMSMGDFSCSLVTDNPCLSGMTECSLIGGNPDQVECNTQAMNACGSLEFLGCQEGTDGLNSECFGPLDEIPPGAFFVTTIGLCSESDTANPIPCSEATEGIPINLDFMSDTGQIRGSSDCW